MPPNFRSHRQPARVDTRREHDERRGSAASRGYGAAWSKAAAGHKRKSPVCRYCEVGAFGAPRIVPAEVVDHLFPHRGDTKLFWVRVWWVSACKTCHDGPKQAAEHRGDAELARLARLLGLPPREGGVVESLGPTDPRPAPSHRACFR